MEINELVAEGNYETCYENLVESFVFDLDKEQLIDVIEITK